MAFEDPKPTDIITMTVAEFSCWTAVEKRARLLLAVPMDARTRIDVLARVELRLAIDELDAELKKGGRR